MADPAGCPIIGNDGVYGQVTAVMANMWGNAQQAFGVSIEAMQELGSFVLHPINVGTVFNADNEWWHVLRPLAPARPDLTYDPDASGIPQPPTSDIGPVTFTAPPVFTDTPPVIPVRTGPAPFDVPAPEGPPALDPITIPTAPALVIPDFPGLREIVLPDVPTITLPTFQGVRPHFAIAAPMNTFGFDAQNYSSALVDKIKSKLSVMIDGAPGLPAAAARQMRDRAYSAVDIQGLRAEQEAVEAFGGRGFPVPDGVLRRALAEVQQNNQNERNKLARDVYLKDVDVAIEDLRFAVAQGVALEGQLMGNFLGTQQLMLDAAKASVSIAIEVMNAEISLANLELEQFKADAQVFRDLLAAELAKLDIYKAALDGKRLIGELNAQDIAVFAERVKAVLALADLYKTEVDAAKITADINVARISAFSETVKAYDSRVHAYDTEWDAFGKMLEADLSQYRRYELATQVFGNRVKIWGDINTNQIEQKRLQISEKELDINAWKARLDRIDQAVKTALGRLDANVRVYAADIDKYRADAAVEQIVSEGNARPMQLYIEQETQRTQTDLKNAELRITQLIQQATLLLRAKETVAQVGAQLGAGFASAMSVHAGISSSLGQSTSCSTSFDYKIDSSS